MKYFAMMLAIAAGLTFAGCDKKEEAETKTEQKVENADGSESKVEVKTDVTTTTE